MITPKEFGEWLAIFLPYGWGLIPLFFALYILLCPEKAKIISSWIFKFLRFLWKGAEKKYIAYDIEGRIDDYVNNFLEEKIKDFIPINIKIDWINENTIDRESFLREGEFILRMRKSENQNKNFVNATMAYIAKNVLPTAKSYISEKQKESIDLFIAKKLFEEEKREVMQQFIDDFLAHKTEDDKIGSLFEQYSLFDKAGLFFPVFLQEMTFLGQKVFADRKNKKIYEEVNGLIEFLNNYSQRKIGDVKNDTTFNGNYCKFGMMIVGVRFNIDLNNQNPYRDWIRKLVRDGVETIYLIGNSKKEGFIKTVCGNGLLNEIDFSIYKNEQYSAEIKLKTGKKEKIETYLLVLRKNKIESYFSSKD